VGGGVEEDGGGGFGLGEVGVVFYGVEEDVFQVVAFFYDDDVVLDGEVGYQVV